MISTKEKENKKFENSKHNKKGWRSVIAGGLSGAVEALIMYPAEFIKTQLQLDAQNKSGLRKFTGPINCISVTLKEHGFFGMYRGLSSLIIGSIPKAAVRFSSFELFRNYLKNGKGEITPIKTFVAGLGAGTCEAIIAVTPMETIKTKFIHDLNSPKDQRKYKGFFHGIFIIIKTEGIGGIYRGLFPTILKQSTNQGTRFLVYDRLKNFVQGGDPNAPFGVIKSVLCGGGAGFVSVMVNNPLDVVKTQMQGERGKYKNSWDCFKTLLKNGGPFVFYRGVLPRMIRVCGDAAIVFTVYDKFSKLINYFFPEK
jgi:solute carrier family 25 citrate transporter 1